MTIEREKAIAQKIKDNYSEKKKDKLDELLSLNAKVYRPSEIFAYTLGIIGALILGVGMCMAMKVIFDLFALGIVVGCVGILIVSVNYFVYKSIIAKRKRKYASKILQLSNEILQNP